MFTKQKTKKQNSDLHLGEQILSAYILQAEESIYSPIFNSKRALC